MFRQLQQRRPAKAVVGLGFGLLTLGVVATGTIEASAATATATQTAITSAQQSTTTMAASAAENVVAQVAPAVVTVVNEQEYRPGTGSMTGSTGQLQPVGSGTGFVIDDGGHIVTNWHVVDGGQRFFVIYSDGTKADATLVGSDEVSDLAVVQVTNPPTKIALSFGDSSALAAGESVLAIGSPLGSFSNTVTEGIVSATGRNFPYNSGGPQVYDDLIQHDAAINPGNSGGPLFDLQGNVVGVNTLGIPTDDSGQPVQGLFFAIPSNTVKTIVAKLIADGSVTYPFFGVSPVGLDPVSAAANNFPVDSGAYVANVGVGGPADKAGIQEGDIILAIGGTKIDQQTSFTEALFPHKPSEEVSVEIQRGDQKMTKLVTLGQRPASA